jgi:hypothetical protein
MKKRLESIQISVLDGIQMDTKYPSVVLLGEIINGKESMNFTESDHRGCLWVLEKWYFKAIN